MCSNIFVHFMTRGQMDFFFHSSENSLAISFCCMQNEIIKKKSNNKQQAVWKRGKKHAIQLKMHLFEYDEKKSVTFQIEQAFLCYT